MSWRITSKFSFLDSINSSSFIFSSRSRFSLFKFDCLVSKSIVTFLAVKSMTSNNIYLSPLSLEAISEQACILLIIGKNMDAHLIVTRLVSFMLVSWKTFLWFKIIKISWSSMLTRLLWLKMKNLNLSLCSSLMFLILSKTIGDTCIIIWLMICIRLFMSNITHYGFTTLAWSFINAKLYGCCTPRIWAWRRCAQWAHR